MCSRRRVLTCHLCAAAGLLSRLSVPGAANGDGDGDAGFTETAPFELEVVEAALLEVTGQLDTLLLDASARVASLLRLLPQRLAITAEVLEELRLVKQSLVELDSRAGAIRSLLLEVRDAGPARARARALSCALGRARARAPRALLLCSSVLTRPPLSSGAG